jgi:hypothetical protein
VIVDVFAVPPGEDEAFVAAWRDEERAAVLYRALRDDVDFRFVEIGEDGAPDTTDGGCVLIEPFVVPAAEDERFLAAWERRREALTGRRGYLGAQLLRPDGDFRFVDVTRWSSPLMHFRASREVEPLPFRSSPALYQPVA